MILNAAHYTNDFVSRTLINSLNLSNPKVVLDLGIGNGSLSKQFQLIHENSSVIGIDINLSNSLNNLLINESKLYEIDLRHENIYTHINITNLDAAICNPPYLKIDYNNIHETVLKQTNILDYINTNHFNTEILFIAYSLHALKENGMLGVIVSDSIASSHTYNGFRKGLLNNFQVLEIIDVPAKSFDSTEAKTSIIIIKKRRIKRNYSVVISSLQSFGKSQKIKVNRNDLYERFDHKFWHFQNNQECELLSLKDIGASVKRGAFTHAELRNKNERFLHTTNLEFGFNKFSGKSLKRNILDASYAKKGNILIGRVGRRCYEKIGYIEKGNILISDCLYKVETKTEFIPDILHSLFIDKTKYTLESISRGVCATSISKDRLMNLKFIERKYDF